MHIVQCLKMVFVRFLGERGQGTNWRAAVSQAAVANAYRVGPKKLRTGGKVGREDEMGENEIGT